jgi:hypothetical protein
MDTTKSRAVLNERREIERFLEIGLCPPTDNIAVLRELGFSREFPNEQKGERAYLWVRELDHGYSRSLKRSIKKQRARLTFVA